MISSIIFIFSLIIVDIVTASIKLELELDNAWGREDLRGIQLFSENDKVPLRGSTILYDVPVNMGYTANIYIGSSRQTFRVVIDTGSADVWVPSVECELESCRRHMKYNPSLSNTALSTGNIFSIKYGTGSVMGYIFQDQIDFAGFVLPNQSIGTVVDQSSYFANKPFDGILGLAFCNISAISEKSLLDRLKENGLINKKRFSLFLSRNGERASELLFDDVNPDYFDGNWTSVGLTSDIGFWIVKIDSVQIILNGKNSLIYFKNDQAIMDTGSTLIYAPKNAAKALHKRIPGARKKWFKSYYTFPCHVLANLTLNLVIGGMAMNILSENLSLGSDDGGKTCISAIYGSDGNEWILGSAFLRNMYSLWDAESRTISFAKLKVK